MHAVSLGLAVVLPALQGHHHCHRPCKAGPVMAGQVSYSVLFTLSRTLWGAAALLYMTPLTRIYRGCQLAAAGKKVLQHTASQCTPSYLLCSCFAVGSAVPCCAVLWCAVLGCRCARATLLASVLSGTAVNLAVLVCDMMCCAVACCGVLWAGACLQPCW